MMELINNIATEHSGLSVFVAWKEPEKETTSIMKCKNQALLT